MQQLLKVEYFTEFKLSLFSFTSSEFEKVNLNIFISTPKIYLEYLDGNKMRDKDEIPIRIFEVGQNETQSSKIPIS